MDTSYFLAIANSADQYHQTAGALALEYSGPYLTTEAVLMEVGNALSKRRRRTLAAELIRDIQDDPDIEVVAVTSELFEQALRLFSSRQDKDWGMTDCVSFTVMEKKGSQAALTADSHFIEAGYQALIIEAEKS